MKHCTKNSISASDRSQTENPIKAWVIHTPTLLGALDHGLLSSVIHDFWTYFKTVILWCSKEPLGQAVPGILYTDVRLQFAVTDTASVVLIVPQ